MGFLNEPVIKAYAQLISIMRFFLQARNEKETNSYHHFTDVEQRNREDIQLA